MSGMHGSPSHLLASLPSCLFLIGVVTKLEACNVAFCTPGGA